MKQDHNITTPPRLADRFFEWYCNDDLQEEIQGDMHEQFHEKVQESGVRWAKCWYWLNVFLFINKYTLRRDNRYATQGSNHLDMLQNYFKTGFRNITKNGLSTFINATGMAMAIGCSLVVFSFVDWSFNTDSFHQNRDEIYVVQRWVDEDGDVQLWGNTPEPLGPALQADFPQITNAVRLQHEGGIMQKGDKVFSEGVTFVDDAFFDLFDFPIKYGNAAHFNDPEGIVLTDQVANRYFGETDPTGETVSIRFKVGDEEITEQFTVKGVMEERPFEASFHFNSLIPYQRITLFGRDFKDWGASTNITFLHIPDPIAVDKILTDEDKYVALANTEESSRKVQGFNLQPLKRITINTSNVYYSMFFYTHIAGFIMLGMIALSLMILVCFNYMNIAIASASTRLKEVSVRKVIGSTRQQIILQFLSENLIVCTLAIFLGVFLGQTIFLPFFNTLGDIELTFGFSQNPRIWLFVLGLVFLTALGGAGYPALYISRLQPVHIFKNKNNLSRKSWMRKTLLGVQFFLTFLTIFMAIAFLFEAEEIKAKPWGYNPQNIVNLDLNLGGEYEQLKNELGNQKNVLAITGSVESLGRWEKRMTIEMQGKEHSINSLTVAPNYLEVMDIELKEGRTFNENQELDKSESIVINEAFRQKMGWDNAIGQQVKIKDQTYNVIGETANFHYEPFETTVKPMALKMGDPSDMKFAVVRTTDGMMTATAKEMETTWKKLYPSIPYDYRFQDEVFEGYFRSFDQVSDMLEATSVLTIIISSMGLFGLAMLLLARRMKEVSIRKVLGANMAGLSWQINKEFFITIIIASILAAPVGAFLISSLLSLVVVEPTILGPLPFILAGLALIVMTLMSISKHIYQLAVSDPTKFLRDE